MLRTSEIQEKCDRDARRAMKQLAEKLQGDDPMQHGIWESKYKFFSNYRVKHSHGTFLKAQSDPLRGPLEESWDEDLKPTHMTYVERATKAQESGSAPARKTPGRMTEKTEKALNGTMKRLDQLLQNPPSANNLRPGAYANPGKYKYFGGGCNFSMRYRTQTEEPWEFTQGLPGSGG